MLLPSFEFLEPSSLGEALAMKKTLGDKARLLAGGTDLLVHLKKKLITTETLISLSRIGQLADITQDQDHATIGACATMAALSRDPLIRKQFIALKQGCDNMGTHLIRNRATVGGNACNASPAGDTLCPLLVYDGAAVLEKDGARRQIPLTDLFTGPGRTCIEADEILTGFILPLPPEKSGACYIQLGKRKSSEINVVNVASYLDLSPSDGTVKTCRIALGAVAPTPVRAPKAERFLVGKTPTEAAFFEAGEIARREDCKPIDDFRGSAAYRQAMVGVLTKRTLGAAYEQAQGNAPA